MTKKPRVLCENPSKFSPEDLFSLRELALKEYHQIPLADDNRNRRSPESIHSESWAKAVVLFLQHNGWQIVRKEEVK